MKIKMDKKFKGVELSVYWPDDWKTVHLTVSEWERILSGKEFSKQGEGYSYDGVSFVDIWWFQGGIDGELEVSYSREDGDYDGGQGYVGHLSDEEIKKEFY